MSYRRDSLFSRVNRSWKRGYEAKRPLLFYGLRFAGVTAALYAISLMPAYQRGLTQATFANARIAHALIEGLGGSSILAGATLRCGGDAIITVQPFCTGFEYSWFLVAAIAAFPASLARKVPGIILGVASLLALNVVRIASLYWTGVHSPRYFASVHGQLWALILNIASVCVMVAWIVWVKPKDTHEATSAA